MKQGLSLVELAEKIEANKARKRDVLVDTRQTTILTTAEGGSTLHLPDGTELDVMQHTHRQRRHVPVVRDHGHEPLHQGRDPDRQL
jgi:hypothetical protein